MPISFSEDETDLIKRESVKSEKSGTLTPSILNLARQKKLFHVAVPQELGGFECSVMNQMNLFEEASRLDGSFGWTLTLGAGAGIFSGFMDPSFANEIFSEPAAFITGSGYPAGTAERNNDGYLVRSGKWKYASGSPHATLFTASCVIINGNGSPDSPEIRAMAFYPREVQNLKTWNSYGLKATASNDFNVSDIQLPERRSFTMNPQPKYANRALFRFPFMAYAPATLASSLLGITTAFLDEAENTLKSHSNLKREQQKIVKHRNRLHQTVEELWGSCESGGEILSDEVRKVDHAAKLLSQACRQAAVTIYGECGMKVLDHSSRLNRCWRDLMTAGQHTMLRLEE